MLQNLLHLIELAQANFEFGGVDFGALMSPSILNRNGSGDREGF